MELSGWRPFWTPNGLQKGGFSRSTDRKCLGNLVGLPGFEPGTSCTPSKRASQAAPQPETPSVAHVLVLAVLAVGHDGDLHIVGHADNLIHQTVAAQTGEAVPD